MHHPHLLPSLSPSHQRHVALLDWDWEQTSSFYRVPRNLRGTSGEACTLRGGQQVHNTWREPYGEPYGEGDVIGCWLHLPPGGRPFTRTPAVCPPASAATCNGGAGYNHVAHLPKRTDQILQSLRALQTASLIFPCGR